MATVKMEKDGRYADIFDSPETIEQAKKDGWKPADGVKSAETETDSGNDADENVDAETETKDNNTGKAGRTRTARQ